MHVTRIRVMGFKRFVHFDAELDPDFTVIVGDNEAGKLGFETPTHGERRK